MIPLFVAIQLHRLVHAGTYSFVPTCTLLNTINMSICSSPITKTQKLHQRKQEKKRNQKLFLMVLTRSTVMQQSGKSQIYHNNNRRLPAAGSYLVQYQQQQVPGTWYNFETWKLPVLVHVLKNYERTGVPVLNIKGLVVEEILYTRLRPLILCDSFLLSRFTLNEWEFRIIS